MCSNCVEELADGIQSLFEEKGKELKWVLGLQEKYWKVFVDIANNLFY